MKISTTMNTLNPVENEGGYSAKEIVQKLNNAGFTSLDFCAFGYINGKNVFGNHPLCSDRWKDWIEELLYFAEELGITFNQSHNLTFNYFDDDETTSALDQMLDRMIEASALLGANITVLHPIAPPNCQRDLRKCLNRNLDYFKKKAEYADRFHVNLALENMITSRFFDGSEYWRYCSSLEQLVELVDAINLPNVGICYDVGHAHYMHIEPDVGLPLVKERLIALHIHDNDTFQDQHLLPFQGTIDWEVLCRTLAKIGYSGDFTYEISHAVSRMPENLQEDALKCAYKTAVYLVERIESYLS